MDIILREDYKNVGNKNDIVSVKTGFARNYLIPRGLAVVATESARKVVGEVIRQQSHKAVKAMEEAQARPPHCHAGHSCHVRHKIFANWAYDATFFAFDFMFLTCALVESFRFCCVLPWCAPFTVGKLGHAL